MEHEKDDSTIPVSQGFITSRLGNRNAKMTTLEIPCGVEGWSILYCWVPLKDLKASNPIQLAEYAVANNIDHEPAFNRLVRHMLRAQDNMIGKVQSHYWHATHKFGIKLPNPVEEASRFDIDTGTSFWRDVIAALQGLCCLWKIQCICRLYAVRASHARLSRNWLPPLGFWHEDGWKFR